MDLARLLVAIDRVSRLSSLPVVGEPSEPDSVSLPSVRDMVDLMAPIDCLAILYIVPDTPRDGEPSIFARWQDWALRVAPPVVPPVPDATTGDCAATAAALGRRAEAAANRLAPGRRCRRFATHPGCDALYKLLRPTHALIRPSVASRRERHDGAGAGWPGSLERQGSVKFNGKTLGPRSRCMLSSNVHFPTSPCIFARHMGALYCLSLFSTTQQPTGRAARKKWGGGLTLALLS